MSTPRMSTTSRVSSKAPKHGARSVIPTRQEKTAKTARSIVRRSESQAKARTHREGRETNAKAKPTASAKAALRKPAQSPGAKAKRKGRVQPSDKRRR